MALRAYELVGSWQHSEASAGSSHNADGSRLRDLLEALATAGSPELMKIVLEEEVSPASAEEELVRKRLLLKAKHKQAQRSWRHNDIHLVA